MRPEARKYLFDILQAAGLLQEFTKGKTFPDYERDALLRSAVERQFGIIGEALNRLAQVDPETAGRVTDFRRIIGFRNLLIHGYDAVDSRVVWGVLEANLPTLQQEVAQMLHDRGYQPQWACGPGRRGSHQGVKP